MNHILISPLALLVGAGAAWLLLRWKLRGNTVRGQDQLLQARETFDAEARTRRQELGESEKRLLQRENNLDRKVEWLDRKTDEVAKKEAGIAAREQDLHKLQGELDELKRLSQLELQRQAGLTGEQAKALLLQRVADEAREDAGQLTHRILDDAKLNADREARRVISIAVERCASNHIQTATSCTVTLQNEEMKGAHHRPGRPQHPRV